MAFDPNYLGRPVPEETFTHSHPSWSSDILHLLWSMASSLFSLRGWQSSLTTSLQVFFGLPLGLAIPHKPPVEWPSAGQCRHVVSCDEVLCVFCCVKSTWFFLGLYILNTRIIYRHPACKKLEWWGAGVVICLERGADLHVAQLMPLPLTVSCFSKIHIGFTFLVPAYPGSPGKRGIKRVCACVCRKRGTLLLAG